VQADAVRCDVSQLSQVTSLFDSIEASGARIKGVVHAAGIVDDGVLIRRDWAAFEKALTPKLAGAWNLHVASRSLSLDFFVLFSSISSLLGSAGQSGYAAGNAFLDALASMRRASGVPGLSVNWGVWAGGGMAGTLDDASRRRLSDAGLEPMDPELALAGLARAMALDAPQVAVAAVDWTRYFTYRGGRPAFLEHVDESMTPSPARPAEKPFLERLQETVPERRRLALVQYVKHQALSILGVPATHAIDNEQGLRDAGLDSLMALELKNRLQAAVGRPLPATLAFDFPTIAAIAAFLADEILGLEAAPSPAAAAIADTPATPDLSGLSDDEAERLLAAELAALRRERAVAGGTKG
jgi:polyketide synthase 12/myxalamid-type polyketide synthase MxaB